MSVSAEHVGGTLPRTGGLLKDEWDGRDKSDPGSASEKNRKRFFLQKEAKTFFFPSAPL
jgi:hypothetical protein